MKGDEFPMCAIVAQDVNYADRAPSAWEAETALPADGAHVRFRLRLWHFREVAKKLLEFPSGGASERVTTKERAGC
jgi:hypothetical protein